MAETKVLGKVNGLPSDMSFEGNLFLHDISTIWRGTIILVDKHIIKLIPNYLSLYP